MRTTNDLLRRIAEMNGKPLEHVPSPESAPSEAARTPTPPAGGRVVAPRSPSPTPAARRAPGPRVELCVALPGVVVETAFGPYYRVDAPAVRAEMLADRLAHALGQDDGVPARMAGLPPGVELDVDRVAFIDLETTGLSNTPLFLIGVLAGSGGVPVVRQYLARDYSEEAAAITAAGAEIAASDLVVTFNGRTFDMPYLRARAAATGARSPEPTAHLDLLPLCRRLWAGRHPNFKLQTLEARLCGRLRTDDIPGAEVPEAYHAFVRTGDAGDLVRIMRHNREDLETLAELFTRACSMERE